MSQVKVMFKNMSWVMISQLIASVLGFIWTILIARYLGVENYGILGFATSTVGLISVALDLGITSYSVRQIATDYDFASKYLNNIFPLKSFLAISTFALLFIILILLKFDETTVTITLLFMINSIFQNFTGTLNGSFQAFEKMKYQGIGNTLATGLLFIFILITIYTNWGLLGITGAYILANMLGFIYEYFSLNRYILKPKFEFDKTFCKQLLISSLPFAVTGMLYTVYYSIDVVMLSQISGNYATGIYNATYRLISVLTLFYGIYSSVIYPVMSKYFKNDKRLLVITYEKSIKYLMLVMIPLSVATMFYSLDIIQLIYGNQYDAASSALSILIWTVCLLFVNGAGNSLLTASHKEVTITKIYSMAAVFNIALNFILIPYLSFIGAAITTVLSDILIFIIQKYVIHKIGQKPAKRLYYDIGKIIAGSLILAVALYFLKLNIWVAIPVGIIIYLGSVYLLGLFHDDDKYIIKEILK